MLGKGSKLYSIVKFKCPRCHKGNFYEGHPYRFSTMGIVKKECSCCKQQYSLEPSFYHGSYYITYALGVALFVTIWVLQLLFFPDIGPSALFIITLIALLLLAPLLYALSKIIWINLFISFKKHAQ